MPDAVVMPFPSKYKRNLLQGSKTVTLRVGAERGKYEAGKQYPVGSYGGRAWDAVVDVNDVRPSPIDQLEALGIPRRSVNSLMKTTGMSATDVVDLVRFQLAKKAAARILTRFVPCPTA